MCARAVTLAGGGDRSWPWPVQMGWHRGGWYTARWVDVLLFPANGPAAERIHPEWQHLAVGWRNPLLAAATAALLMLASRRLGASRNAALLAALMTRRTAAQRRARTTHAVDHP